MSADKPCKVTLNRNLWAVKPIFMEARRGYARASLYEKSLATTSYQDISNKLCKSLSTLCSAVSEQDNSVGPYKRVKNQAVIITMTIQDSDDRTLRGLEHRYLCKWRDSATMSDHSQGQLPRCNLSKKLYQNKRSAQRRRTYCPAKKKHCRSA